MFLNNTNKIKKQLGNRKESYLLLKESKEELDFLEIIKPAFDEFELLVQAWQESYHKEKITIPYLNDELIERTKVQILELFVQSYQHKTSKKMFLQLFKTVEYVLDSILITKGSDS